jgi:hypothetical protein
MASSIADRAQRRAAEVYERAIRDALAKGDDYQALLDALRHLRSEITRLGKRRPGDGAVTSAQLAARITALASQLHDHRPIRPDGCPKNPQPDDLIYVFETALADARGEGSIGDG